MNIKHLIITRFLNNENMHLGSSILDEEVIKYRMELITKYLYPSLNNQSNLNFTHIILIHKNLPKKYIKNIEDIPCKFKKILITYEELKVIVKNEYKKCDFLITSRIDDDDMIYYNAVEDIQKSINATTTISVYGYQNGCTMIDGEIETFSFKKKTITGMIAILLTLIINTKKVKKPLSIHSLGNHTKIKEKIKEDYKNLGINTLPDNFWNPNLIIDPAWIYVRHEKSDSGTKHRTNKKMEVDMNKLFGFNF
jgi:hypothetical protein